MNQEEQDKQSKETTPIEACKEEPTETSLDQHSDALAAAVSQLQQLTAAETQALIHATAQAMGGNNHQQFFSTLDSTNVVLAASIVAAAAASANSNNANEDERSREAARTNSTNNKRKRDAPDLSQLPADLLKRELMNQKVRADNRERKKRWRQQNEERNKDNDLRCRVNKRAHKLFGKEDNEHKKAWIDDEFRKRQQKRKEKERRKGMIDNSLGAAQPNDLNTLAQHFLPPQQQGQALPDMNYLTMLCNSLGISGAARALIGNAAAAAFSHTTVPEPSHETVAMEPKMTEINAENKDESEETTTKPNVEAGTENVVTTQPTDITSSQDNGETENKDQNRSGSSAPLQLIEFLQHLQQYQPQQQNIIESNSSSSELAALPAFPGMDASRPEEKLAALLASTLQAAAAAATSKEDGSERSPAAGNASSSSAAPAEHTEFPLDAVLTLMQLNAGWRQ